MTLQYNNSDEKFLKQKSICSVLVNRRYHLLFSKFPSKSFHLFIFIYFIYFILFATLITKNIGKEEEKKKKKWRGDLTETLGAYERLGLLEL